MGGRSTLFNTVGGWTLAWISAGLCSVALDWFTQGSGDGVFTLAASGGLACTFGILAAVFTSMLSLLSRRLPSYLVVAPWLAATGIGFGWLANSLGVAGRLSGRYQSLAVVAIVVCVVAALGLSALAVGVQPGSHAERSWLDSRPTAVRRALVLVLVFGAIVLSIADARVFQSLYPQAHFALRATSIFLVACVLYPGFAATFRTRSRWQWMACTLAVFAAAVPFVIINDAPRDVDSIAENDVASEIATHRFSGAMLITLRHLFDFDGDGFSSLLAGGDCAPLDAEVNPGADEIPANGIDDNCLGGDAPALLSHPSAMKPPPVPPDESPMSVVLITIDTVRPDRMSAYGAARDTTPRIASWAKEAIRFESAFTSGLWTSIALPSLMLGLYPRRLKWSLVYKAGKRTIRAGRDRLRAGEKITSKFVLAIEDPRLPIAQLLRRRGMRTIAVVDDGFTDMLQPRFGFGAGFDEYVRVKSLPKRKRNDEGTANLAIDRLRARTPGQRFFMWVHFFGPHGPSRVHAGSPTFGKRAEDKYDHELHFADRHVGRLLDAINESADPIAVILTADHGEYIHPKGTGRSHGTNSDEGNVRVPLLIKTRMFGAGTSESVASTVDVAPTILALTQTPAPKGLDGVDLHKVLSDPERYSERIVFSDSFIFNKRGPERFRFDLAVAIGATHKLAVRRFKRTTSFTRLSTAGEGPVNSGERRRFDESLLWYLESTGGTPRAHRQDDGNPAPSVDTESRIPFFGSCTSQKSR